MAKVALSSPFGDEEVEEVALPDAPLARVVAQIRYRRLSVLATDNGGANAVAAALRQAYPLLNEAQEVAVTITPEGVSQAPGGGRLWQLRSVDLNWQVSFGPEFVSLDTSTYTGREDFMARLKTVLTCFADTIAPPFAERIGVRYINRIENVDVDELKELVRPEVLGGLAVPMRTVTLTHSLSEALYNLRPDILPGGVVMDGLQARWGVLPPGAVLDPTLPPVPTPSWVLDLDSFRVGKADIAADAIADEVRNLAERAYRYFRWVVTPAFLTRFGGEA